MNSRLRLRPVTPDDMDLLCCVYASTREQELALVDWDEAQKAAFLAMQFNAQHAYYQEHYPQAAFQLILLDGEPAGRLYIDRWPDQIRIVDITLLPEYRNLGIGTHLLSEILAEGERAGLPVTIHVEMFNPAMALYRRMGFREVGEHGVYRLMCWTPTTVSGCNRAEANDAG